MKKVISCISMILILVLFESCINYVGIPFPPRNPEPDVIVSDTQVIMAEKETVEAINTLKMKIPELPTMGNIPENDDCDYTYDENGKVNARYGTFEKILGIDDGFVDVASLNEPVESVGLLGNTYTPGTIDDISVGNSNYVRDSIFEVEDGVLKINMFYFYGTLLFGDGIYVNGERLTAYDKLFSNEYTDLDLDKTGVTLTAYLVEHKNDEMYKPDVVRKGANEYTITYKIPKNEATCTPRYEFWRAELGDIVLTKNSNRGITFDAYGTHDVGAQNGEYPFGWRSDSAGVLKSSRIENVEYMIIHEDGKITHLDFTIHFKMEAVQ